MEEIPIKALASLIGVLLVACTAAQPFAAPSPATLPTTVPAPTSAAPTLPADNATTLAQFPLELASTWVYSSTQYQSVPLKPLDIMTATYLITQTVAQAQTLPPYLALRISAEQGRVSADPRWIEFGEAFEAESWFAIHDGQLYSTAPPEPDAKVITTRALEFDFPLAVGKSWCPEPPPEHNPQCASMGKRTVRSKISYTSRLGTFDDCYVIVEDYNSGGVTQLFCVGVGVVARKYDHAGSRFGFEDVLVRFSKGAP